MSDPKDLLPAVSVALRRGTRLLLVRRGRAPSKGLFAFPGGRVEEGESLEAAARRELFEETGLEAGALSPHSVWDIPASSGSAAFRLTVFAGEHLVGEPVAGDDAAEAGWYGLGDMDTLPVIASVHAVARSILGDTILGHAQSQK